MKTIVLLLVLMNVYGACYAKELICFDRVYNEYYAKCLKYENDLERTIDNSYKSGLRPDCENAVLESIKDVTLLTYDFHIVRKLAYYNENKSENFRRLANEYLNDKEVSVRLKLLGIEQLKHIRCNGKEDQSAISFIKETQKFMDDYASCK